MQCLPYKKSLHLNLHTTLFTVVVESNFESMKSQCGQNMSQPNYFIMKFSLFILFKIGGKDFFWESQSTFLKRKPGE